MQHPSYQFDPSIMDLSMIPMNFPHNSHPNNPDGILNFENFELFDFDDRVEELDVDDFDDSMEVTNDPSSTISSSSSTTSSSSSDSNPLMKYLTRPLTKSDRLQLTQEQLKELKRIKFNEYRKRYRRRFNPIPRIPKHDIKREIPMMYINTLNSFDLNLMDQFLERYCTKDCSFAMDVKQLSPIPSRKISIHVYGKLQRQQHFKLIIEKFPDLIIQIQNINIKQRSDTNETQIVSQYYSSGTDIQFKSQIPSKFYQQYQQPMQLLTNQSDQYYTNPHDNNTIYITNEMPIEEVMNYLLDIEKFEVNSQICWKINEQNLITEIQIK